MMKMARDTAQKIAQIRVSLDQVTPKVVRILAVPFDIPLHRLHLVIQAALGWSGSPSYRFRVRGAAWGPFDPGDFRSGVRPASRCALADLVAMTGRRSFKYLYDSGEDWRCSVIIQTLDPAAPWVTYPLLLAAEGRTPHEDIGGPAGYEDYLTALCDPAHERRMQYSEAYGLDFDPTAVDIDGIDRALARLTAKLKPAAKAASGRRTPKTPDPEGKSAPGRQPAPETRGDRRPFSARRRNTRPSGA